MREIFSEALIEAVEICLAVFLLMVVVELINARLQGLLSRHLSSRPWLSYFAAALLALIPGCEGEFLVVTLYTHKALSFGALLTCMIATTGDEGLTMLSAFPGVALVLFAILGVLGVSVGWIADLFARRRGWIPAVCEAETHHPGHESWSHFVKHHVVQHILLRHLPRIFLWTLGALVVAGWAEPHVLGEESLRSGPGLVALAALVGLIPSSGPHQLFVAWFDRGLAPFSALVASSVSQTGHGVLPLFHTSWRAVLIVKLITLSLGILVGLSLTTLE